MALVNEGEGVAYTILTSGKIDLASVKQELDKYISGNELRENKKSIQKETEKYKEQEFKAKEPGRIFVRCLLCLF